MSEILKTEGLVKEYGRGAGLVRALDDFSCTVDKGEFVAVMGPSGSGKSTLLQCVSTIDTPTHGRLFIHGKELNAVSQKEQARFRRENLGFIFQEYNLIDALTVAENIGLALTLNRKKPADIARAVEEIAALLGIEKLLTKRPYEISGGERQRTACARAVIHKPKILMADEPTGALDSHAAKVLMETFAEINSRLGTTIIMVTHDAFSASYAGRILFLKDGKLFSELTRGGAERKKFYETISEAAMAMGE